MPVLGQVGGAPVAGPTSQKVTVPVPSGVTAPTSVAVSVVVSCSFTTGSAGVTVAAVVTVGVALPTRTSSAGSGQAVVTAPFAASPPNCAIQ